MRLSKLRQDPLCERCKAKGRYIPATHVHHINEVADHPSLALAMDNLESLCTSCHSQIHAYGHRRQAK